MVPPAILGLVRGHVDGGRKRNPGARYAFLQPNDRAERLVGLNLVDGWATSSGVELQPPRRGHLPVIIPLAKLGLILPRYMQLAPGG